MERVPRVERRREPRQIEPTPRSIRIEIVPYSGGRRRVADAKLVDSSDQGIGLQTIEPLGKGMVITVEEDHQSYRVVHGHRSDDHYRLGGTLVDGQKKKGENVSTSVTAPVAPVKRLNINLTQRSYQELEKLQKETRHSMTELVRLGLGLVRVALEESGQGNKLILTSPDGQPLREIVLPR